MSNLNCFNSSLFVIYIVDSSSEQISSGLIDYMINSLMNENLQAQLPHGVACYMNTEPLTVDMLDSLSVHTKMLYVLSISKGY